MVMYRVEFLPAALAALARLDKAVAPRILKKLRWFAEHFDAAKLESLSGPLAGLLKLRVGDYRVIYEVDREEGLLTVHLVGHRRDVYEIGP
jgi:mRNA interferase RelE/StbE